MFGFNKKKDVVAVGTGTVVRIEDVPDEVFAQKMLGDGAAIVLEEGTVYSPVGGKIIDVTETLHAYCIESDDGLDILVHIGVNTVELKGEGFSPMVKAGDSVKPGDVLCNVDIDLIKQKGYPLHTPVLITNIDSVKSMDASTGHMVGGKSVMFTYQK